MTAVPIDHSHRRQRPPEPFHRRTGSKVWRNSQASGRERWPFFNKAMGARLMLALKIHAEKQRRKGERTGTAPRSPNDPGGISFGAIRVAEFLVNFAAKNAGRLDPSIRCIARALNVPMKSVHAWKAQLKRHGFLNWRRRWISTDVMGPRGPIVEQDTNAYWLTVPAEAEKAADAVRPPPPDDRPHEAADPALQAALERARASVERRLAEDGPGRSGRR